MISKQSIRSLVAGMALVGVVGQVHMASATVICEAVWPSTGVRNMKICSSGANQGTGKVENLTTTPNRRLTAMFIAGADRARTLALDSMGNTITGCEAFDTTKDGSSVQATCNTATVPGYMYVWVK